MPTLLEQQNYSAYFHRLIAICFHMAAVQTLSPKTLFSCFCISKIHFSTIHQHPMASGQTKGWYTKPEALTPRHDIYMIFPHDAMMPFILN